LNIRTIAGVLADIIHFASSMVRRAMSMNIPHFAARVLVVQVARGW
jgi:hypothetical protein